jgi:hypothetical protein
LNEDVMAIGLIFDAPGVTQAQYEQVRNEVNGGTTTFAEGVLYHAAGPTENGWAVVEIWESQEMLQQFFEEKLGQALQRAGIQAQPRLFQVQYPQQP